ncbi:hypothetical protein [Treponema socranskii]|uniref:hypothetical protein n=1 Tax=Treponema socranskii TaxID=53419 RepID=UPI0023F3406F|nr:hypothetical protein [Treponema socranskii]
MKKVIAIFFILLVSAGVVFYFGWTQFKVGAGECGVLISKTSGVNSEPVMPGKFSWHWECLLPTNAVLRVFSLKPRSVTKTVSGSLPSADVYSTAFQSAPDFSYRFDFICTARVTPENIIALVKNGIVTDAESLDAYLDSSCTALAGKAAAYILMKSSDSTDFQPETVTSEELLEGLRASVDYPNIVFDNFAVLSSKLPDRTLYNSARDAYIEAQHIQQVRTEARNRDVNELLKTYPELQGSFSGTEKSGR